MWVTVTCLSIQSRRFWNKKISLVSRVYFRENFSTNNMKKTGLNGGVYEFSVGYRAFDTSNIISISI